MIIKQKPPSHAQERFIDNLLIDTCLYEKKRLVLYSRFGKKYLDELNPIEVNSLINELKDIKSGIRKASFGAHQDI